VSLTERGESFYNPKLPSTLQELQGAGIVEDSDGAKVIYTEEGQREPEQKGAPPLMVQKSDRGFGYARRGLLAAAC
jgi:arginyl-tRNA synthetase